MVKAKIVDKTKKQHKFSTGQMFNFAQDSYLERTSRPIYAVVFLLPFILIYELGVIVSNTNLLDQYPALVDTPVLVDTFVWLQKLLISLGFGGKLIWIAPPLVVAIILIALQLTSGKRWRFWLGDIWRMGLECVLLAIPLVVLVLFIISLDHTHSDSISNECTSTEVQNPAMINCSSNAPDNPSANDATESIDVRWKYLVANIITGIGAGIYEEFVFRLILISFLMMFFEDALKIDHGKSIVLSVLISAILFSAHHHIDFLSGQPNPTDPFNLTKFAFRTIAGIYFAILFAFRGFGITAGTHAFYNIIAVSITARYFSVT